MFKRPSRSLEGEKGEFNSHRKTKVCHTVGSQGEGGGLMFLVVDCPTQLTLMTWICQLRSMTNTSEKYERTQQGNLLPHPTIIRKLFSSSFFYVPLIPDSVQDPTT